MVLAGHSKVSLELSRLHAPQLQLSQPVFVGEIFHSLSSSWSPLCLPYESMSLLCWRLQIWMQHCRWGLTRAEVQNQLPWPALTALGAAWVKAGLLDCECTLLIHVQLFIYKNRQVLLCKDVLNDFLSQHLLMLLLSWPRCSTLNLDFLNFIRYL